MKYIGTPDSHITYWYRPGAYVILTRASDSQIGIVTNGKDFFYLGGGIEKDETPLIALKRELQEEVGYTLKNIQPFTEIGSYFYSQTKGYLQLVAYVFIAELQDKVTEPIEKDHHIVWVNPKHYLGKMCREWQEEVLKEYIQKNKL